MESRQRVVGTKNLKKRNFFMPLKIERFIFVDEGMYKAVIYARSVHQIGYF